MTDQNVIKGSAPTMHVAYNASTNRQTGDTADLNGNLGSGYLYDIENRLLRPGASSTVQYGYDAGNKRVWRGDTGVDEIVFWAGSQKLITYNVTRSGSTITGIASSSTNVYFGGRLMYKGAPNYPASSLLTGVKQDRLGSMNGKFYPYGQERPSATTNDKEKFTGYFRDASTGLDYADQRYEQPGVGRFMTPDKFADSIRVQDPASWNRYVYVEGDPINASDPTGQIEQWLCQGPLGCLSYNSPTWVMNVTSGGDWTVGSYYDMGPASYGSFSGRYTYGWDSGEGDIFGCGPGEAYYDGYGCDRPLDHDAQEIFKKLSIALNQQINEAIGIGVSVYAAQGVGVFLSEIANLAAAGIDGGAASFFEGTSYSQKVLDQMATDLGGGGGFHAFPSSVGAFEGAGQVTTFLGDDGAVYQELKIQGSYLSPASESGPGTWHDGTFEIIKDATGEITHWFFNPRP